MTTVSPESSDINNILEDFPFHEENNKICATFILFMFLFVSCHQSLVTLKYKDGKMYNKSAGLECYVAPTNYQPVSIAGEYAYYKKSNMILYKISGLTPQKMAYSGI